MNSKSNKILAVAAVALFCITAMAAIFSADDSSAADERTYTVYVEVINSDGGVSATQWVKFTSEADNEKLIENANKAFANYGLSKLKMSFSTTFGIAVTYDTSYLNVAYYYGDNQWKDINTPTKDYPDNTTWALEVNNGYINTATYNALPADDKKAWAETFMGYGCDYKKIPGAVPSDCPDTATYHYFAEVINASGKVESSKWIEFESMKDIKAISFNATAAFKESGLEKLTFSINEYGIHVYYDGSDNSSCMYADGKEWKGITDSTKDYLSHDVIALSVGNGYISTSVHDALSDAEKQNWKFVNHGDGYDYQKIVTEPTDGYGPAPSNNNNTVLIVVIVVVAVIVVALVAFFIYKKKSA